MKVFNKEDEEKNINIVDIIKDEKKWKEKNLKEKRRNKTIRKNNRRRGKPDFNRKSMRI
jgi:hypothetical protein